MFSLQVQVSNSNGWVASVPEMEIFDRITSLPKFDRKNRKKTTQLSSREIQPQKTTPQHDNTNPRIMEKTIGVLGGGQLGRMLVEAANLLDIRVNFLDAPNSSAKQVSNHDGHVDGSFKVAKAIKKLAANSDVLTVEIEHVDTYILEDVAKTVDVQWHARTVQLSLPATSLVTYSWKASR